MMTTGMIGLLVLALASSARFALERRSQLRSYRPSEVFYLPPRRRLVGNRIEFLSAESPSVPAPSTVRDDPLYDSWIDGGATV